MQYKISSSKLLLKEQKQKQLDLNYKTGLNLKKNYKNKISINQVSKLYKKRWVKTIDSIEPAKFIKPMKQFVTLGASTLVGFKKKLYNQVIAKEQMLYPLFNRRKHSHSHVMIIENQQNRFSKSFYNISKNAIGFNVGFALKGAATVVTEPNLYDFDKTKKLLFDNQRPTTNFRVLPLFLSAIETETAQIVYKCQNQNFFKKAQQILRHQLWIPRMHRYRSDFLTIAYFNSSFKYTYDIGSIAHRHYPLWLITGEIIRPR